MRSRAAHLRPPQVTIYPPAPSRTVFRVVQVHVWFKRKIPESADADIDQTERWMIDRHVTTALCAITAFADVAAFESSEEFFAFGDIDVLFLPQCERAYRRGGITSAVFAMAITHLQRITAHFDLHAPQ